MVSSDDPMSRKAQVDMLLDRTALQLRQLLQEAATELRPFPALPGSFFTCAIEVDAPGADRSDRGLVVVAEDGELYELEMSIEFSEEVTDPVAARDENLKKLEDLPPMDYILLANEALTRVTEHLMERRDQEPS